MWVDQPGERISIPEELQGQVGFKAAVSQDGRVIACSGNPVMPTHLLTENMRSDPNGEYLFLISLRSQFFAAESPFTNFRPLWKNRNTSYTTAIAISPAPDYRLAVLVYEFPFEHPDSYEEAIEIYRKDPVKRSKDAEAVKKVGAQGYEGNIYLIDTNTGNSKKLANLFTGRQHKQDGFISLVNESALTWDSTGNLLFSHDYDYVFSIDMSGQRKNIFKLKNCIVFSSIYCDPDNNLSMVVFEKGEGQFMIYEGPPYLVQIDLKGNLLKKEESNLPPGYTFEENNITHVEKDSLLVLSKVSKSSKDFKLLRIPQEFPKSKGQSFVFHDPNDVQFYYAIYGVLPNTNEVIFAKKGCLWGGLRILSKTWMHRGWNYAVFP